MHLVLAFCKVALSHSSRPRACLGTHRAGRARQGMRTSVTRTTRRHTAGHTQGTSGHADVSHTYHTQTHRWAHTGHVRACGRQSHVPHADTPSRSSFPSISLYSIQATVNNEQVPMSSTPCAASRGPASIKHPVPGGGHGTVHLEVGHSGTAGYLPDGGRWTVHLEVGQMANHLTVAVGQSTLKWDSGTAG